MIVSQTACERCSRNSYGKRICDPCRLALDGGIIARERQDIAVPGGRTDWERHAIDSGLDGYAAREDAVNRGLR